MARVTSKHHTDVVKAKSSASIEPLSMKVIAATEGHPPEGTEAISWVLLTNLTRSRLRQRRREDPLVRQRFGIETWHKVLKSGCKVEDCLLETAERSGATSHCSVSSACA